MGATQSAPAERPEGQQGSFFSSLWLCGGGDAVVDEHAIERVRRADRRDAGPSSSTLNLTSTEHAMGYGGRLVPRGGAGGRCRARRAAERHIAAEGEWQVHLHIFRAACPAAKH